jgi:hypothetical protein
VRLRLPEFSFCPSWKMMSEADCIQGRLQRQTHFQSLWFCRTEVRLP